MAATVIRPRSYSLPDIFASEDDLLRLHHRDLPGLSDVELFAENITVRAALASAASSGSRAIILTDTVEGFVTAVDWLAERVRAVADETRSRRRSR